MLYITLIELGGDIVASTTLPRDQFPYEIEQCAEFFFYKINTSLDEPASRSIEYDHRDITNWSTLVTRTSIEVINRFDFPIELYWHDEGNKHHSHGVVQPGQSSTLTTFLGHIFAAHRIVEGNSESTFGEPIDYFVSAGTEYIFSPYNRMERCEIIAIEPEIVEETFNCADMYARFHDFSQYVWHTKRIGLNYVQPKIVPAVTHNGFYKQRLPEETYVWLKNWYDEQQRIDEITEHGVGTCMNQQHAPSQITHLPPDLKSKLTQDLQPILEEWYNGELVMTSIYGIRKYTNGSILRMHVDTLSTHVVSAIINVDQEVEKDWPLLILDHDDNEHNVTMAKGDMVLYESAKLLHGRPEKFVGKHYDNIFIHFKPSTGWDLSVI